MTPVIKAPFKRSRLFSTCLALFMLAGTTQANSARIENVTVYAGKQSDVTIDLNSLGTLDNKGIDVKQAILTPGGPYLKQRLPLLNEQAFDLALANSHAFIATADKGDFSVIHVSSCPSFWCQTMRYRCVPWSHPQKSQPGSRRSFPSTGCLSQFRQS